MCLSGAKARTHRITRESKSSLKLFGRVARESKLSEKIEELKRVDLINCESRVERKHASEVVLNELLVGANRA